MNSYWRRRHLFTERRGLRRTIFDRVCWLLSFALFVAMLTAPRWWPT